jgi:hypothetical protein
MGKIINSLRLGHEVSMYLIKQDSEARGFPLTLQEVREHCLLLRRTGLIYHLKNGDYISYGTGWSLNTYNSYKESITERKR